MVNRRCRLARTSCEGREKAEPKLEWPGESALYPGKADSEGGDLGDGNRSSSRRSLSPFLKAIMGSAARYSYCRSRIQHGSAYVVVVVVMVLGVGGSRQQFGIPADAFLRSPPEPDKTHANDRLRLGP